MKKILMFLLLCVFVLPVYGRDRCSGKTDEYTIDKRCYVTDEQKKEYPYNAVVGLVSDNIYCTGSIVKYDDIYYVYTAAHCVRSEKGDSAVEWITIKTQQNGEYYAKINNFGSYIDENGDVDDDWAIYKITRTHLIGKTLSVYDGSVNFLSNKPLCEFTLTDVFEQKLSKDCMVDGKFPDSLIVGKTERKRESYFVMTFYKYSDDSDGIYKIDFDLPYIVLDGQNDTRLNKSVPDSELYIFDEDKVAYDIGYGTLKIMSDIEIKKFKEMYISWLEKQNLGYRDDLNDEQKEVFGFSDGGIDLFSSSPTNFVGALSLENSSYFKGIFKDGNLLKVSECAYSMDGDLAGCQSWGGNSGGPIVDKRGVMLGILTGGEFIIGGAYHAEDTQSVNLQTASKRNVVKPK